MSRKIEQIGVVTHYFTKIGVAVIELRSNLKKGERIMFRGMTTDFEQTVDSMQIDRVDVHEARSGDSIGLKVDERVRPGDMVYRLLDA